MAKPRVRQSSARQLATQVDTQRGLFDSPFWRAGGSSVAQSSNFRLVAQSVAQSSCCSRYATATTVLRCQTALVTVLPTTARIWCFSYNPDLQPATKPEVELTSCHQCKSGLTIVHQATTRTYELPPSLKSNLQPATKPEVGRASCRSAKVKLTTCHQARSRTYKRPPVLKSNLQPATKPEVELTTCHQCKT